LLLTSLDPAAVTGGRDLSDAVRIGDATLSRSDAVGAATSVAERGGTIPR
jgi:fatty acid CoA ligase FadD36